MPTSYQIFCCTVFIVQAIIAGLSFGIAYKRVMLKRKYVDILMGISWTLTSLWWLFCAITQVK